MQFPTTGPTLKSWIRLYRLDSNKDSSLVASGLYYKHLMIVNDNSRVVRMSIISDAPSCGVTYDHHSDNSRGVIYAPREHLQ
jgi:hypothetical protein